MPTLDEILATLEEDDPDAAKALREQIATVAGEKEQLAKQLAARDRDYKLATDKTFRERYPRAMMVFDRGKLTLGDDLDAEGLAKALKDKEEELADLGVPLPAGRPSGDAPQPTSEEESPKEDPAQSWGEPVGGSPHTPEHDPVKDYWGGLRGTTETDRRKAVDALVELNRAGEQRPEGKIWELAEAMGEDDWNRPIGDMRW